MTTNTPTTNIPIIEFHEKWTCINTEEDLWTCGTDTCKIIFESEDYYVVKYT